MQARAQQVEEQLATTKSQLDELRQAQAELEMRNQLLESAAKAQSALSTQPEDALLWKVCKNQK